MINYYDKKSSEEVFLFSYTPHTKQLLTQSYSGYKWLKGSSKPIKATDFLGSQEGFRGPAQNMCESHYTPGIDLGTKDSLRMKQTCLVSCVQLSYLHTDWKLNVTWLGHQAQ